MWGNNPGDSELSPCWTQQTHTMGHLRHPANDGSGSRRELSLGRQEVPLLFFLIFNFSYKNLDVYP